VGSMEKGWIQIHIAHHLEFSLLPSFSHHHLTSHDATKMVGGLGCHKTTLLVQLPTFIPIHIFIQGDI